MLSEHSLPFRDEQHADDCLFQQDNAPAHSANLRATFNEESITDLGWLPKSSELNVRKYIKFVVAKRTKRNNESGLKIFILDFAALIRNDQIKLLL